MPLPTITCYIINRMIVCNLPLISVATPSNSVTLLCQLFYQYNPLLKHLNNGLVLQSCLNSHCKLMQCALYTVAPFCVCFDSSLSLRDFSGQEKDKTADKDKYSYQQSNQSETHGFLTYLHLFDCTLTSTPGHTSCTVADGKVFTDMSIKCNQSQTSWSGKTISTCQHILQERELRSSLITVSVRLI